MKSVFVLLLSLVAFNSFAQNKQVLTLKKGTWISELQLNKHDVLPFTMRIQKGNSIIVENADEDIQLSNPVFKNDSFYVKFPYFNSELVFKKHGKKELIGYWVNYNKGADYKIPFYSIRKKSSRFKDIKKSDPSMNLNGKWQVTFEPNTKDAYPAVGIFEQKEGSNKITGTFLTETGDYRFLEGNCTEDSLFLSCFDGSHAFLFKAAKSNNSLNGKFFSGSHWKSNWEAVANENYQLTSPDDLTYIVNKDQLSFELKTLDGELFKFPNPDFKDKVVIIQIMGTWCPNCLDETHYYKELYNKYHDKGLEIISIGYEIGKSFEDFSQNINRLKNKLELPFTFLIGGKASKSLASEHFKALNEVISFPTSIYIGKDGEVKRVHTGFNGPGTGSYYKEYVEKTNALIESLLNQ